MAQGRIRTTPMSTFGASSKRASKTEAFDLLPVSVATLLPTGNLDFNLYLKAESNTRPRLYRERNYALDVDDIERLVERGLRTLYVAADDQASYKQYLRDNLDAYLDDETRSPAVRVEMLHTVGRDLLEESFQHPDTGQAVRGAKDVGGRVTGLVAGRGLAIADLFRVLKHDFDTFSHVMNVSTYSVVLAEGLGMSDSETLNAIAVGALLHDLGMLHIPEKVRNKEGPLRGLEWELIWQHPRIGFEQLCLRDDLTWDQLMMVYRHHERLDGRGYPVRLVGDEVHPWARLCAVVDVFDAMTAARPYRRAIAVNDVVDYLGVQAGVGLDREIVQCWKSTLRSQS